eukprot:CAMPEP_0181225138 /NCGR_PEP_ID=MMETSP1096-20121128/31520_1 /TAXON_ID=156174 ORGANISM="Chrysochromulina ericina, Strain CCMP281" /NCGR_SAMPLE_ID=MMETSP1096 /ASSEMBLY_ACC=CAM_ASM_000453 /LENGTH=77 /DNA_ID=CAMNT_0023318307 /DNA_START=329 /DNA_END=561 /DNA_ORIENTATION=+
MAISAAMQSPGDPLLTTASPAPADAKRVVLHAASCEDGLGGEPRHVCPLNDLKCRRFRRLLPLLPSVGDDLLRTARP